MSLSVWPLLLNQLLSSCGPWILDDSQVFEKLIELLLCLLLRGSICSGQRQQPRLHFLQFLMRGDESLHLRVEIACAVQCRLTFSLHKPPPITHVRSLQSAGLWQES